MTPPTLDAIDTSAIDAPGYLISVVVPVYNEGDNIVPCLRRLWGALKETGHEILICYDFDGDSTLPAVRAMTDVPPTLRLVKNDLGRGVLNALRTGFAAARGDVVVTTMADLSDPPDRILRMAEKLRDGADVVSGSRYMRGGSQSGGPIVKRTLSRLAGLSLWWVAGMNTHDATTNFRGYRRDFLRRTTIESKSGFEVALELTTKAHNTGAIVDEVPSTWTDRTAGESRFLLMKWLPGYLRWFMTTMWTPLIVWLTLSLVTAQGFTTAPKRAVVVGALAWITIVLIRRWRRRMSLLDTLIPLVGLMFFR